MQHMNNVYIVHGEIDLFISQNVNIIFILFQIKPKSDMFYYLIINIELDCTERKRSCDKKMSY